MLELEDRRADGPARPASTCGSAAVSTSTKGRAPRRARATTRAGAAEHRGRSATMLHVPCSLRDGDRRFNRSSASAMRPSRISAAAVPLRLRAADSEPGGGVGEHLLPEVQRLRVGVSAAARHRRRGPARRRRAPRARGPGAPRGGRGGRSRLLASARRRPGRCSTMRPARSCSRIRRAALSRRTGSRGRARARRRSPARAPRPGRW